MKDYAGKFELATRYRNRLVHDGVIRIEVIIGLVANRGRQGISVKLAENPADDSSQMNVDAIEFCNKAKADVLKLLDRSYALMLQHHQVYGDPPW